MRTTWHQTLVTTHVAGPALVAAAAASMLISASPVAGQNRYTLPANQVNEGDTLHLRASGLISCVVTTPGTARFDLRFGSVVVFDTGALNLNVVAKTNVPWWLDVDFTIRTI